MFCTLDQRLSFLVTGTWGANTFPMRKQLPNPHFQNTQTFTFLVFQRFPQINVGGDTARFLPWRQTLWPMIMAFSHPRQRIGCDITLSMPLGFFMGLLCTKLGLTAKQDDTLSLSCALSELSQSSTFLRGFFFQFLHQFSSKVL